MVDGWTDWPRYFLSIPFGEAQGKGFVIDLETSRSIVGVSVQPCFSPDLEIYDFVNLEIIINDAICLDLTTPALFGLVTFIPCRLQTDHTYPTGRFIHFRYTELATTTRVCIYQVNVYGFQ